MKIKFLLLVFSVIFSLTMLPSGLVTREGMQLFGVNSTDGLWNLALIEELRHSFPPQHPGFAGVALRGYHFIFHLVIAVVSRLTFIPVTILYFQIAPIVISVLWAFGVYHVVMLLSKDKTAALISVFISFFGGSFAFILHLIGQKSLSLDSGFGIAQPFGSSLPNPAYASSVVIVIWSMYCLLRYLKNHELKWLIILTVLSGVAVGFKAYAGMILIGGLLLTALWRILVERKLDILISFVCATGISVLIFYPFNSEYGSLTFAPFLTMVRLIEGPLNFTRWDELYSIQRSIGNHVGTAKLFSLVLTIYVLGNIGTRIVSIAAFFPLRKKQLFSTDTIYYISLLGVSFVIPIFFLQKTGGGFNIVQMHWYVLFLLSVYSGIGFMQIIQRISNHVYKGVVVFCFVTLTLITSSFSLISLVWAKPPVVSHAQLSLLKNLSVGEYEDRVLALPNEEIIRSSDFEGWFWHNTDIIIPALGGKRVYVTNEVVSFPYEEKEKRLEILKSFIENGRVCAGAMSQIGNECQLAYDLLRDEGIQYVYTIDQEIWLDELKFLDKTYENESGSIYKVLPL